MIAALGEAMADGELIIVPGNHDHHLIEPWLERRLLEDAPSLELEQAGEPEGRAFEALCALRLRRRSASPTPVWIRDDVYAIHGHYLDRHLTVPTVERLGVGLVERVLGMAPSTGPDPLVPPEEREAGRSANTSACKRRSTPSSSPSPRRPRARAAAPPHRRSGSGRCWAAATRARPRCAAGSSARSRSPARSGSPTGSGSARCDPTSPRARSAARASTRWATRSRACGSKPTTSSSATPIAAAARRSERDEALEHRQLGPRPRAARRLGRGQPLLAGHDLRRRRRGRARASPPARRPLPRGARRRCVIRAGV